MLNWQAISTVFLDMDGTLLDLHFDNYFWLEHVPVRYAQRHGMSEPEAREDLMTRYRAVQGTLDWYCIDYWTEELGLDITALKHEVAHKIAVHPHVEVFLQAVRDAGRRCVLVTNAHRNSVTLKLATTGLAAYFDRIVVSHDLGAPKERVRFWELLQGVEPYDPASTVLVDDNLDVLRAAAAAGIGHLLAVRRPDTRADEKHTAEFRAIGDFRDILPVG